MPFRTAPSITHLSRSLRQTWARSVLVENILAFNFDLGAERRVGHYDIHGAGLYRCCTALGPHRRF